MKPMTNTYHISGMLENDSLVGRVEWWTSPKKRFVFREVEAESEQAAIDYFEIDGWEWAEPPKVRLISEAAKLERIGVKPLFDMKELETGETKL